MTIRLETLGEAAVLLHVGNAPDAASNARALALAAAIGDLDLPALQEVVPAYASVLIEHTWLPAPARTALHRQLLQIATGIGTATADHTADVQTVPVCYGGRYGPDLAQVAAHCDMSVEEVIRRHLAGHYRVAMIGFAPGFPYLSGLDPRLATPRRATPRTHVPAGAVGIAGGQTGIYPAPGPGGWQLIGRTPERLFDPSNAAHPCHLLPGQQVRFTRVDAGALATPERATPW